MIDPSSLIHIALSLLAALAAGAIGFTIGLGWERNEMIAMQVDNMTLQGRCSGLREQNHDLRDEIYRLKQLVDPVIASAARHVAAKAS